MASTAESVCELVDTFASSLLELRCAPAIRADVDAAFGNCAVLKEDMEERRVLCITGLSAPNRDKYWGYFPHLSMSITHL